MIEKGQLAPFVSVLLTEDKSTVSPESIHEFIISKLKKDSTLVEGQDINSTKFDFSTNGIGFYTPYAVSKKPNWINKEFLFEKGVLENTENHLIISMKLGGYWAFFASEAGRKEFIRTTFLEPNTYKGIITPLSIGKLQALFINGENVKVLWLSDIRGKYSHVPSSKVISGADLEDKLNPILDQTYMMSASRTRVQLQEKEVSFGVSPFKSVIWSSNCDNWNKYEQQITSVLDYISQNDLNSDQPISILAFPIHELDDFESPYEFTFISKDTLDPDAEEPKYKLLKYIEDNITVNIDSGLNFTNEYFYLEVFFNNEPCAEYKITPKIKDYKISYNHELRKNYKEDESKIFKGIFKYPDLIKCWFDSGHALIGGMAFKTDLRKVQFTHYIWDVFDNTNILKEKPLTSKNKLALHQTGNQNSLFCWVKNNWSGRWSNNTRNDEDCFNTIESQKGLLLCDDGPGELADFIHLDEYKDIKYLTFIHVKAAHKDTPIRDISVGAHDVVVNQAVKNLMRCDRKSFLEEMEKRESDNSDKPCWEDGKLITFSDFETKSKAFLNSRNIQKRVVVIQPHTMKSKFASRSETKRGMQLNTLLVAADNAIRATGADFFVIGYDD